VSTTRRWILWLLALELAVLTATGAYLHFRYVPRATQTWGDVFALDSSVRAADMVRTAHRVASHALILTALVAATLAALRPRRLRGVAAGAGLFVVALLGSFTGFLLPWDQLALWAVTVGTDLSGYTWLFDDDRLRFVLIGGREIGLPTLRRWYLIHFALGLLAAASALALHPRSPHREPVDPPRRATAEAQPSP
jgi:quinol-cytochrome oxidoreductase complex cytochrome b subunit